MKNYLVIGNPIKHSQSPQLHNFWINQHNLDANYNKKLIDVSNLKEIVEMLKTGKLDGLNVTVPFKQDIIPLLDKLSPEAEKTQSVNTVHFEDNKLIGHNTDIAGFELAIRHIKYDVRDKKILILGAGGVVASIVLALKNLGANKVSIMNRTKEKAENIKKLFRYLEVLNWGEINECDMIINATSIGLTNKDIINLDFSKIKKKIFFYDLIYNPSETNFLKKAKEMNHSTENGRMMFIYQAHQSFTIWHKIMPKIDANTIKILIE